MQTTPLKPGELMLDAASFVSLRAVLNACRMPQCRGFSFYTGGDYGVARDQINAAIDNGKLVGPNWERRGNEAMFGSGVWAVDSARSGVEAWGIDPSQVPTVLSGVDFSTTPAVDAQLDYWWETACDRADATNTLIGYYGETRYGNRLIQKPWWNRANRPTWTWGGNGMISGTAAKQKYGFPSGVDWSPVGVTVDESEGVAGLLMVSSFDSSPIVPPEDDVPHSAPVDYITCNAGATGHHVDGTVYRCPTDGTVFRCLPSGNIQWVRDGNQWGTMNAIYGTHAPNGDVWNTPVGDPDAFGILIGAVPGRPDGWTNPNTGGAATVDINAVALAVREQFKLDPLK